jgi:hypothetical protein
MDVGASKQNAIHNAAVQIMGAEWWEKHQEWAKQW